MIVVIGSPVGRLHESEVLAAGMPAQVALAAAAAGSQVQLLGRTGDDPVADGLLQGLSRGGVGHVALLRDPARQTPIEPDRSLANEERMSIEDDVPAEPAVTTSRPTLDAGDIDLGLRYLADFRVIVVAEAAGADVARVVSEAAGRNAARLVMVVGAGSELSGDLPADAIVFEAPEDDPDGVFAALVGTFAAALDNGTAPGAAFRSSIETEGWTAAVPE